MQSLYPPKQLPGNGKQASTPQSKPQKPRRPVGMTLGCNAEGKVLARLDKLAEEMKAVGLFDFVRVGSVVGRVVEILDAHDYRTDNEVAALARQFLVAQADPDKDSLSKVYKRFIIEPLGSISGGSLAEYQPGSVGFFQGVYRAAPQDISGLYPACDGLRIGCVASGARETGVPFFLGRSTALTRHMAIFGKNGSGKTNLLKEMIAANLESKDPIPMLVFGHPDIGLDNPNDAGSKGLSSLFSGNLVLEGYQDPIKISSDELSLQDIFSHFEDISSSMRDLWHHVHGREPRGYIKVLATYDVNEDPLELHRKTVKDPQTKAVTVRGVAGLRTIDSVCKQARILNRYVDENAPPVLDRIVAGLKQKKTVLVNTFNMSDYQQGWFIRLVLERLQKAGKSAIHKGIPQRFLVVVDEAQHFIARAGDAIGEFCREARKFGLTIAFSTQSPLTIPESIKGQVYTVISFHINRPDIVELAKMSPTLYDLRHIITRPPLKSTVGMAVVQAVGYPYPAVVKVPHFERRFEQKGGVGA